MQIQEFPKATDTQTVQIDLETRDLLRALKVHPRETWNDVIKRLAKAAALEL